MIQLVHTLLALGLRRLGMTELPRHDGGGETSFTAGQVDNSEPTPAGQLRRPSSGCLQDRNAELTGMQRQSRDDPNNNGELIQAQSRGLLATCYRRLSCMLWASIYLVSQHVIYRIASTVSTPGAGSSNSKASPRTAKRPKQNAHQGSSSTKMAKSGASKA